MAELFDRVLVANRGEIAVRVIRACRELGIAPVAVYGKGEEDALHVRAATDAYRIPGGATLPYLDVPAMIEIARRADVQAVHPGYGFLAENAAFAEACAVAGLVFIGPPPDVIRAMGDKVEARRIATSAGVPVVPGTDGPVDSVETARAWADRHGYPVAFKAAGGGGGRGFRVARDADELGAALAGSAGEAERYFANPVVYLERYLEQPRHVEVQVFADNHGAVVALGERDCSIQRRHQKLIEETPSPAVDESLRQALNQAAVSLADRVGYRGAGTVEFLLTPDGQFYFLEMNTRIQVEHTVTEEVTGIDLVNEQFRVAAGCPLSFVAVDVQTRGHAIECRINAEDPARDFAPTPGVLTAYHEPRGPGVRVDSAMDVGAEILPTYDSLIAKLVTRGRDRTEAIARMERCLADFRIEGVPTTIPFHQAVLGHPVFRAGDATTAFLAEQTDLLTALQPAAEKESEPPRGGADARELVVEVNDRRFVVRVHGDGNQSDAGAAAARPTSPRPARRPKGGRSIGADGNELISPIQGTVLRVAVKPGLTVRSGELVCVVEAMKMENELVAHRDGTVTAVSVAVGDPIKIGGSIVTIE